MAFGVDKQIRNYIISMKNNKLCFISMAFILKTIKKSYENF